MAINFGDSSTQKYASIFVAHYNHLVTTKYSVAGNSNSQVIWTGATRTLPGSDCQHCIIARLDLSGSYGGAYKVQYSTDGGSNWNNVGTAELGDIDNGTGMNMIAMGALHHNFNNHGLYSIGIGSGFLWKYDPNGTSSRLRIVIAPDPNSTITFNRRQHDTSYNSISHIQEFITQDG
mgnify:CR=1 FL=1|jgi:hypothetical protein|tara:strand:+ start:2563 stop:3093 length:531 start_codon:yes stop_codon:yes gene_type:complete